jgi:hypothetical protein
MVVAQQLQSTCHTRFSLAFPIKSFSNQQSDVEAPVIQVIQQFIQYQVCDRALLSGLPKAPASARMAVDGWDTPAIGINFQRVATDGPPHSIMREHGHRPNT